MTDNNNNEYGSNFSKEISDLGKNISDLFKTAWDSPQRKEVQKELESGMQEFKETVNRIAEDFSASETGKQIKSELNELKENISSGDLENEIENEILKALNKVNEELSNVINKWSSRQSDINE